MPLTPQQRNAIIKAILDEEKRKAAEEAAKPSLAERAVPMALRVGGGVGGALLGSAVGPAGTLAGGGIGAALGETGAQFFERATGQREEISPTGIAIEGALGAVPLGRATGLARAAGQGALLSGGGYAAHKVLEEGQAPGLETIPIAALGALLGGGAHAGFTALGKLGRRAPVPPAAAPEAEPLARLLGAAPRQEPRALLPQFSSGEVPIPMGGRSVIDVEPVATDFVANPMPRGLTGMTARDAAEASRRGTGRVRESVPQAAEVVPPSADPLALPAGPPVRGLLPERTPVESPIPLPAARPGRTAPLASDRITSPEVGLTGMAPDEAARRTALTTAEQIQAGRLAEQARPATISPPVEAPVPPAAAVAPEAAEAVSGPQVPAELAAFLKGQSKGVTLAMLRKKFGPKIEALVEELAQAGKLRWGGRAGAEKFSLADSAGFAGNELTQMLGGGLIGGAVGATQGETPEERLTYGILGAGAGAAGGAQLGKFLERRRLGPNPSKVAEAILGSASATKAGEPTIPAAVRVATDKKIPLVGGQRLSSQQGDVPIVESATPQGPLPQTGPQPRSRYETAGINLGKYDTATQDFIKTHVLDDAFKAAADQQRRGRIPIAWMNERAKYYASRLDKPLAKGTVLPAEQTAALTLHEAAMNAKAAELAQIARESGNPLDQAKFLEAMMQTKVLNLSAIGNRAELGRAMRYLSEFRKGMTVGQRLISEAQKQGRLTKLMGDFDGLMAQVPADPTEAAKFLSAHMEAGTFDKMTSYFMANILSAIPSYIRNGIGSAVNSVSRVAIKGALAGPIDALLAKLTGRQRAIYSSEVLHDIAGASYAARQGLDDAWSTFRNGFSSKAIQEGVEFGELNVPKVEFAGGLLNPWNQPGRILESTDRFFQTFNQAMSKNSLIWARAQREADAKGLVGQAFDDFMAQRMSQLQTDDFIRGQAVEIGREQAFREDPGKIANTLIGLKKQAPVLQYIIPFVKTVSNIFRQGIEHSPLAPMLSKTRAQMFPNKAGMSEAEAWMADRKQSEAFAKWAFGLASMVPIGVYAATGKLSGSGPSDPAKRAALYEQGWRPNSIQIGDKWYTYSTWQPLSIPMALIANAFESYEDSVDNFSKQGKEVDWEKVAASTAFKVLNSATQQSYLQGVMALSAAMEDPDQFAENFLRQMAQGFYPMSGLQRTLARAVDPNIRENKTVQESLQRITPGLSESLPSRLNRWGEDVTYSGGPAWRAIGGPVFGGEGRKQDPVNDELMRLKIDVGLPTDRVIMGGKQAEISRQQGHELRQIKGKLVRRELERVILAPGYENLPDPLKRERIEDTLAKVMRSNSKRVRMGMQSNPNDFLSLLRERAANGG
jgi:hypothetical protein